MDFNDDDPLNVQFMILTPDADVVACFSWSVPSGGTCGEGAVGRLRGAGAGEGQSEGRGWSHGRKPRAETTGGTALVLRPNARVATGASERDETNTPSSYE